ncbi:MAG: ArsR family transcriptional regulator [Acidimicrobiales bacterium]
MKVAVPTLAPLLRSEVQGRILAEVFADPEAEHSITELARRAWTSVPTAIREIDRAEAARAVTTRRLGNTRLVKADGDNPLARPLAEIVLATFGPPAVLAEELSGISGIDQVYLFGSWAARYRGEPGRAPNDIDVLVIGTPDRDDVFAAAERAEARLRLPVQVTIRSPDQWADRGDPFVAEVRSRALVPVAVAGEA